EARAYAAAVDAQTKLMEAGADEAALHEAGRRTGDAAQRLRALPMSPPEEVATIALVDGLSFALEPWLRGDGRLRYARLAAIVNGYAPNVVGIPPNSVRPDVIVSSSGKRFSPDDWSTPFAVVGWPKPIPQSESKPPRPKERTRRRNAP